MINPEASGDERLILSVALRDPELALDVIALVPDDDLDDKRHREILRYLARRIRDGKSLDFVEVLAESHGLTLQFGGAAYLCELQDHAPSTALDLAAIARRIRARAMRRQLGLIARALLAASLGERATYDGDALPDEPDAVASVLAVELARVAAPPVQVEWTIGEALDLAVEDRTTARAAGRPMALHTGSREIDDLLDGGVRRGELVVIAGRPGSGKTALAIGIGAEAAAHGARVGVISLEMSAPELADRVVARSSSVALQSIRRGSADDGLEQWRDHIRGWDLRIATPPWIGVAGLVSQARRWVARGLDLLIVDYLQLMRHDRAERRDLEVGSTATACKQLARELGIPVLLLAQLNRDIERRAGVARRELDPAVPWFDQVEVPKLADLKDSGQIEQDADVVAFPIRASQYGIAEESSAAVVFAKQRNGRTGTVPMRWSPGTAAYLAVTSSWGAL